ncbi:hypothetical protein ATCC90586_004723 [Pythium insidiosum]|nr:hypothetical protein ATCC90586_004723 [Pythium insidiosum]
MIRAFVLAAALAFTAVSAQGSLQGSMANGESVTHAGSAHTDGSISGAADKPAAGSMDKSSGDAKAPAAGGKSPVPSPTPTKESSANSAVFSVALPLTAGAVALLAAGQQ